MSHEEVALLQHRRPRFSAPHTDDVCARPLAAINLHIGMLKHGRGGKDKPAINYYQ